MDMDADVIPEKSGGQESGLFTPQDPQRTIDGILYSGRLSGLSERVGEAAFQANPPSVVSGVLDTYPSAFKAQVAAALPLPQPKRNLGELVQLDIVKTGPDDKRGWQVYDSGLIIMERRFADVLAEVGRNKQIPFDSVRGYKQWFQHIFGHLPYGLELAGQGKTFVDLGIDGVANCLKFPAYMRREEEGNGTFRAGTSNRIALLDGDLRSPETLDRITETLRSCGERPGIILLYSVGGIFSLPQSSQFYIDLISKFVDIADPECFLLLMEYFVSDYDLLHSFLKDLMKRPGFFTSCPNKYWYNLCVAKIP